MRRNRPPGSLGAVYDMLYEEIEPGDSIGVDAAVTKVRETERSVGTAEHVVERLVDRGYLYKVDGQLYITEHRDGSQDSKSEQ
ncbi:hypothetical protein BDK61_4320 [Haloarcula quadrata]|uniref:GntR family transcriptional regulator n=2 Tax=Haloarcula quadrata TaxID=182779 RepID=A0A495QQN4_9EURY|nr:hypothetical protein BDK61_4320 [Haloarcula quadrata]